MTKTVETPGDLLVMTCMGMRLSTKGRLAQAWIEPSGHIRLYQKPLVGHAKIGTTWKFHQSGDSIFIGGDKTPELVPDSTFDKRIVEWSAEDAVAHHKADVAAAERKIAKQPDRFKRAIEPLRIMFLSLRSHSEREAFVARVGTELRRP